MQTLSFWRRWNLPHYFSAREIQTGKVDFDPDTCTACGRCARSCPVGSIVVPKRAGRKTNPTHVVEARPDLFLCFACSNCFTVCPENSVTISRRYTAHYYFNRLFRTPELTPPRKY
jgi:formate hydrogenlyase subunit 6/NADH:ubiquinone oxidoreductase subunit I